MNIAGRNVFTSAFFMWLIIAGASLFYLFTFENGRIQLRQDRIKFGIDLVGGTYITLEVQTDKAIETELNDKMQFFAKKFKKEGIVPVSKTIKDKHVFYTFDSVNDANEAGRIVSAQDASFKVIPEDKRLKLELKESAIQKIKDWAVKGNKEVLRTRLDGLGVGEITIAEQGEKNIVVELPNVDDPQKAKAMIGKAALLEVKLIEKIGGSEEELLDDYDGELPDGMEILKSKGRAGSRGERYYLVSKYTDLTGRLLKDSYAGFGGDKGSEPVVHFKFNPAGGNKFYELTRKNPNRQVAVIVDGVVISDPVVRTPIGAEGYIHGDFTMETASELAALLKSGAFVAPVTFEEERQIGPSLGAESIHAGLTACLLGLSFLFVFSLLMYKMAGFFAFLTLLYNLLVIMLALAWMRATLTLPGIAGMVLTTGMAIDASILIFEKIKEELATGLSWKNATKAGFADAMTVILDSNITTFLVGIVLYKFGTGPIQGFAVTMMIGIIATLITGLFFMRSLFNLVLYNFGYEKVKI